MKKNVTIVVDDEKLAKMQDFYADNLLDSSGEYVVFMAKIDDLVVTAYTSKKGKHKVTFNGELALQEAQIWDPEAAEMETKSAVKEEWEYFGEQIGSDEVGVGDFLLPMIVVAAYVSKDQISLLRELGIHDSKKLSDKQIMEIGPRAVKEFSFSKLTLPNEKYNEMLLKNENLNSLKAKLHNRALLTMHREHPHVINIFIDEFVSPKTYYGYLNDPNEEIVGNIISKTKGESHFPCVALASVIARYAFLLEVEKLNKKYDMSFPFGAGKSVTAFAKEFINKFGMEEFNKIAKKNFANYREAISEELL